MSKDSDKLIKSMKVIEEVFKQIQEPLDGISQMMEAYQQVANQLYEMCPNNLVNNMTRVSKVLVSDLDNKQFNQMNEMMASLSVAIAQFETPMNQALQQSLYKNNLQSTFEIIQTTLDQIYIAMPDMYF